MDMIFEIERVFTAPKRQMNWHFRCPVGWVKRIPTDSTGKLGNSNFSRYSNRVGRVVGPAKRRAKILETSMYAVSPLPVLPFK
jgi:hypothetical protein